MIKTFAVATLLGVASVFAQQDFDADAFLKEKEEQYRSKLEHKKIDAQMACDYAFEIFDLNHDGLLDRARELPLLFKEGAKFIDDYTE